MSQQVSIKWELCPEATHYLPKTLQQFGSFWRFYGAMPIMRWDCDGANPVTVDVELSSEGRANLIARPADWSTAPEEATHHVTSIRERIPTGWYRADGNKMRFLAAEGEYTFRLDDVHAGCGLTLHARPATDWSGEGLPPVGAEVEVINLDCATVLPERIENWKDGDKVECIAHCAMQGAEHVSPVFFNKRLIQFSSLRNDCYRPIRTPEQIAAEERLHKIRNAATAIARTIDRFEMDIPGGSVARTVIEAMIDAGYVKGAEVRDTGGVQTRGVRPVEHPPKQDDRVKQIGIMNGLLGHGATHRQGRILFDHGFRQAPGYAELLALAEWIQSKGELRFMTHPELVDKAGLALAAARGEA